MSVFGPYQATVTKIHDGDTITVDVLLSKLGTLKLGADRDLGFQVHRTPRGITVEGQSVRVYGCNAPELATLAGKEALEHVYTLLKVGDVVQLVSHGWDKYGGRIDGQVTLPDGRDLATVMIADGHAVVWDGQGAKPVPAA